jgi:hypothetical protein
MTEQGSPIPQEEIAQLQKKFSEIKHSINNALAVMMALSEMSQRRPDYAEKLASTVLAKAPQIVTSLQEFTGPERQGRVKPKLTLLAGAASAVGRRRMRWLQEKLLHLRSGRTPDLQSEQQLRTPKRAG